MANQPTPSSKLTASYKPFRSWEPIHTNGEAAISSNSRLLFSTLDQSIIISDLRSAKKLWTIDGDSSSITSISCTITSSTNQPTMFLLIAFRSLSIRIYSIQPPDGAQSPLQVELIRTTTRAHEAPISISTSDPTGRLFATGDTAGVVRVWDSRIGHCTHVFKGHGGIVSALSFDIDLDSNRARLAVGSGDCRIKLWDLSSKKLVGLFEGGHVSIIRGLEITRDGLKLVSGSRDKVLIVWSLSESAQTGGNQILKTIPIYETIESIGLIYPPEPPDQEQPTRKKSKKNSKVLQSGNLDHQSSSPRSPLIYTAGDKGFIRLWNLDSGELVDSEENHQDLPSSELFRVGISDTRFDSVSKTLLVNKTDQTFSLLQLPNLELIRQVVGSHDEIIDISLLRSNPTPASDDEKPSHLVVATNSPLIRILDLGEDQNNCRLLSGHDDIVLCLAKSSDRSWFVSGSKDKTARVWKCFPKLGPSHPVKLEKSIWRCVATCEGHVQSLGAISVAEFLDSKGKPTTLLATASQDRTVKLWDLSNLSTTNQDGDVTPSKLKSLLTMQIHDKDINSIDFSPDCKLLASGSQDKLGKLFSVDHTVKMGTSLKLVGILKGHNRGIWCVKFSRTDRFVLTGSGDCTIKLWSTADDRKVNDTEDDGEYSSNQFGSCLKTFEGHSNSVLRLDFTNFGQRIISTSSDCLIKVWDIKTQVCLATLGDQAEDDGDPVDRIESSSNSQNARTMIDGHDSKIWALDVVDPAGSQLITGGADSRLICWKDITEEIEEKKIELKRKEIELNQDLENFIRLKDYRSVIRLLIKLDKPVKLLKLFLDVESSEEQDELEGESHEGEGSITGSSQIDQIIQSLNQIELIKLLNYIKTWNSIPKSTPIAQKLLFLIFKSKSIQDILSTDSSPRSLENREDSHEDDDPVPVDQPPKKPSKSYQSHHDLREILKILLVYSDRNLTKIDKTCQESHLIEFLLNQFI